MRIFDRLRAQVRPIGGYEIDFVALLQEFTEWVF